jgi:MFS family permease
MRNDGLSPIDRRALASIATQFFVNGALFASFVPRLPEIRDRVEIGTNTLGVVLAIGALAGLVGSVVVGHLIERFGTRHVLVAAGLALCSALPLIGFATVPAMLVVGLALMSIFDVLVDSAMNLQGSWISGRRSVPVINRLHGLWSLGTVIGGLGSARLAGAGVSLQWHLLAVAVVLMCVVIGVGRGLLRVDEHPQEPVALVSAESGAGQRSHVPLVLFALAGGCTIAMELTSTDWAAFRLSDDFGASAGVAPLAYVAFTVGMTSGRFGGDAMIARFGQSRVADGGIALTIAGLAVASFAPNRWVVIGAYLVAGLGIATQFPKLYDDAARYPGRPGAGLGALTGGSRLMFLVAPILIGNLADSRLSVGAATSALTLPAAVGFIAITRRTRRA